MGVRAKIWNIGQFMDIWRKAFLSLTCSSGKFCFGPEPAWSLLSWTLDVLYAECNLCSNYVCAAAEIHFGEALCDTYRTV